MIRVLDAVVADAIAAGEVVERPASVVKELVENAVDAGARRIDVEVASGGAQRILVVDDGCGIDAQELVLAFTRHATSKVRDLGDLSAISTLGFRGEALASIAAVSRVECISATRDDGAGARITVDYGVAGKVEAAPPVRGTRLEVRGLFENTPARRAFLRKEATETGTIVRTLTGIALVHPGVRFTLMVDGRRALAVGGSGDLVEAFAGAYPGIGNLLTLGGGRADSYLDGVMASPGSMRRTREHLYLSVNGRLVSSRSIAFAVEQAFRTLAPPGLFPVGVVRLHVPLVSIDVNVHPTKREVRFRDERELFSMVQEACVAALRGSGAYGGEGLFESRGAKTAPAPELADADALRPGYRVAKGAAALPQLVPGTLASSSAQRGSQVLLRRGPFRLLGQVMNCYIVAEGPSGLVLVDQHAAHERIQYNRLVSAREQGAAGELQPMLLPPLLHLAPGQAQALAVHARELLAAGIELEDFGAGTARLVAHHPALPLEHLDRLALDVLDELASERPEGDAVRRLQRTTATVACHSAIRFGQALGRPEMEQLLRDLEMAEPGISCPHGRPTLLEVTDRQLRREFGRS
ncbi:MAG: DNA mismatch repair endonuclease MutL [Candidatus Dormibacteria bacterium]